MAVGDTPCSSALHILPSPGTGPELGHIPQRLSHRFLTSISSECNELFPWKRHYSIFPVHTAGTALCSPAALAVGGCSLQAAPNVSIPLEQHSQGKGKEVLSSPPQESPQICDQPQCRDWLVSLSPNSPWTGLSVKIPKPQSSQRIVLLRGSKQSAKNVKGLVLPSMEQPHLWCFPSGNQSRSATPNPALVLVCFTFVVPNWMFHVN